MALLDRLRLELDRAGRQAQRAFDEGRLRLDLYRARQSLDRFAQRFGYASYRAKRAGAELSAEDTLAHMNNLVAAEAEVTRLETLIAEAMTQRKDAPSQGREKPEGGGATGDEFTDRQSTGTGPAGTESPPATAPDGGPLG